MIIRGTTPTHTIGVPFDTALIQKARVTYSQNDRAVFKKEDCTIEDGAVSVRLSQADTLLLKAGEYCDIELHILTTGGDALVNDPTRPIRVVVYDCKDNEVIE